MSSSNYRRNKAAVEQFQKELMAMLGEITEINTKVINQATNEGIAYAKRNTPVGVHPNPVTFTLKNGKDVGKVVSFKTNVTVVGGLLRKSWSKLPTKKTANGVETEIVNRADYASYWNYGHRIVTKRGGPTKGFVKGTHVLEKMQAYVQKRMIVLFDREVKEVQKKHDK